MPRILRRRPASSPSSTGGRLVYAVGDVHGRLDLLDTLIGRIRKDALEHDGRPRPILIFVGDYVDRGADSRGVVDRVLELSVGGEFEVRALKGNHEEALLAFLSDPNFGPTWAEHGGVQTLASYGVSTPILRMDAGQWSRAREAFVRALPPDHLRFLVGLELTLVVGDFLFVHAGVRPGVPIEDQAEHDLLWIRKDFLGSSRPSDKIVVHGHTPAEAPFLGPHRIGIDTGAYATGVLTAIRLLDGERRLIQAGVQAGD